MTAKKVTEWVVTARHSTKALAEECILQSGSVCNLDGYVHYICPHAECGKPWPLSPGTNEPVNAAGYLLLTLHGLDYCCDATAEDCEGAA